MKVSLVDVDGHHYPNLALCKIAGYHRACGDVVDWYQPLFSHPDKIFASKVFSFTPEFQDYAPNDPKPIRGGTGYNLEELPAHVENVRPDFSIYPDSIMRNRRSGNLQSFGFLTRGCIRSCPWCIVPKKEGMIRPVATIEDVAQDRKEAVLMDNNFLAADPAFVEDQLDRIQHSGIRIDFNQGLDARLITSKNAKKLASCGWVRFIRFSCDTKEMIVPVKRAVRLIREAGCKREIFCYLLVREISDAEERLRALVKLGVTPFAQPYRDFSAGTEPTEEQRKFAAFSNLKGGKLCLKIKFTEYKK